MDKKPYISIISPVYKAEEIIPELVKRIEESVSKLTGKYEIILVDDSSPDNSWKEISKICSDNLKVKGVKLSRNFGQHNAIMAGLNNCRGDYIITIDDDLQHPPEFFPDILNVLKTNDVCYTNYKNRKHIGWKKFVSSLNNIVSSFILNKPLKIYMSSYRGMVKKIQLKIIQFKKSS